MKFETVIFDLDGTLLNTLTDLTNAVNHILKKHGYPTRTEGEIRRFLGNGARDLLTKSLPEGTGGDTVSALLAEYQPYYLAHSEIATAPYAGIPELLDELRRKGVRTAIVSNKNHLQVAPLAARFFPGIPVVIGEQEGLRKKPAPDMIKAALKQLNASPDTAALMGDSEVDGRTAENAGIRFLAAGWGFRDRDELTAFAPALYMERPADLLDAWKD